MNTIVYTKILDVNDIKFGSESDAGDDLFLPKFDENMKDAILERNKNLFYELKSGGRHIFYNKDGKNVMHINKGVYSIVAPVSLPCGIQFNIPVGYYAELRNRSSNFGNNFDVKTGIIDNSYTYGTAFQLTPINFNNGVAIEENTRIGQLILLPLPKRRYNYEIFKAFEQLATVIFKRNIRSGGFGSTGNK